jgi:uncharacterized membrane protein SirB2
MKTNNFRSAMTFKIIPFITSIFLVIYNIKKIENLIWVVMITGIFYISFGMYIKTKNFRSAIVFKIIPILSGLFLILNAAKALKFF